jgi:hypothetical protein
MQQGSIAIRLLDQGGRVLALHSLTRTKLDET